MHRAEPERLVDYATTCFENGQVQVQPVEFRATIDEVSDSGSRTPNVDVIGSGAGYSCVIGGTPVSEVPGRHRTRNDGEASFIQLLTDTGRQLKAIQDRAQAVLHLHVLLAVACRPFDARRRSVLISVLSTIQSARGFVLTVLCRVLVERCSKMNCFCDTITARSHAFRDIRQHVRASNWGAGKVQN